MPRIQKKQENIKPKYKFPIYSDYELEEFDKQLEEYRSERELRGKTVRYVSVEGENRFMQDMGALNKYGAVIISEEYPYNYGIIRNKLDQHNNWIKRKEYGLKIQAGEYEKMAGELITKLTDF